MPCALLLAQDFSTTPFNDTPIFEETAWPTSPNDYEVNNIEYTHPNTETYRKNTTTYADDGGGGVIGYTQKKRRSSMMNGDLIGNMPNTHTMVYLTDPYVTVAHAHIATIGNIIMLMVN